MLRVELDPVNNGGGGTPVLASSQGDRNTTAGPKGGVGQYPVVHITTPARCSEAGEGVHPLSHVAVKPGVDGECPRGEQPRDGCHALLHRKVGRQSRPRTVEVTTRVVGMGNRFCGIRIGTWPSWRGPSVCLTCQLTPLPERESGRSACTTPLWSGPWKGSG